MTETTPLIPPTLADPTLAADYGNTRRNQDLDIDQVYRRFTDSQKRVILAIVSFTSLIAFFTLTCFVPMIPAITTELNTTAEMLGITIGVYLMSLSFGCLFWAGYADFYGRRPIYLISLGIYAVASIAVAGCQDVWQLTLARALQAFGVCSFASVGSGTITDIYEPSKRGMAMGIYCGVTVVAPSTAPLVGGIIAQYASWRWLQVGLAILGVIFEGLIWAFLPETSLPGARGVDKLPQQTTAWNKVVFLNPLRPLTVLLRPNIAMICVVQAIVLMPEYVLLVPMPYILERSFGITNGAHIGAVCMSMGAGSVVGAPLSGYISDGTVIKYQKKRGKRIPEDRLRASFFALGILLPISLILFGVAVDYIRGPFGLTIAVLSFFIAGIGIDLGFGPCLTYIADSLTERTVEGLSGSAATRLVFLSVASGGVLPVVKAIGNLWTDTAIASLIWLSCILIAVVISWVHY